MVAFRVGTNDAEFLAKQFAPIFDIDDLQFLPNANTAVRMMIGGVPVQPFSMATLPPLGHPNQQLSDALKQLSWAKYGRPKAEVEKEIFDRLKTEARPAGLPSGMGSPWDRLSGPQASRPGLPPAAARPAAFGQSPFGPPPPLPGTPAAASKPYAPTTLQPSSGSFLDDWLAKRKASTMQGPAQFGPPAAASPPIPPTVSTPAGGVGQSVSLSTANPPQAHSEGELKIDRSQTLPPKTDSVAPSGQGQTVRIDKDGNLSYK